MSADTARSLLPLELSGVTLELGGAPRIRDLDLVLGPSGRTVVMGPNGAGKSLLLRLCHGLMTPSRGTITWRGSAAPGGASAPDADPAPGLASPVQVAHRQAMVFQRPMLLRRSVLANVVYALAARGLPRDEREPRAREALAGVGLSELCDRPARRLSGGEQQRVSLARAWALAPEVLFLDEPAANLDPAATRAIETSICKIHERGTRIIMSTHDLGQARRLADDAVVLHRGSLLAHCGAAELFEAPPSTEVRAFLAGELLA